MDGVVRNDVVHVQCVADRLRGRTHRNTGRGRRGDSAWAIAGVARAPGTRRFAAGTDNTGLTDGCARPAGDGAGASHSGPHGCARSLDRYAGGRSDQGRSAFIPGR